MKIHDISLALTPQTVTWESSEKGYNYHILHTLGENCPCNLSEQSYGSHTGTHLDAPLHFIENGKTVDQLDINTLVGAVELVDVPGNQPIDRTFLESAGLDLSLKRIIFRTENTRRDLMHSSQFHTDYVGVAPDASQWLVDNGYQLVGVDYLSVGPYHHGNIETHRILLEAGIIVLEGLVLNSVNPGKYLLAALPLKVTGVEGSPCRAVLIEGLT